MSKPIESAEVWAQETIRSMFPNGTTPGNAFYLGQRIEARDKAIRLALLDEISELAESSDCRHNEEWDALRQVEAKYGGRP